MPWSQAKEGKRENEKRKKQNSSTIKKAIPFSIVCVSSFESRAKQNLRTSEFKI